MHEGRFLIKLLLTIKANDISLQGNASQTLVLNSDITIQAPHLSSLYHSNGNVSKQIATMRAALEDESPEEWLTDSDYNTDAHRFVTSIDAGLASLSTRTT